MKCYDTTDWSALASVLATLLIFIVLFFVAEDLPDRRLSAALFAAFWFHALVSLYRGSFDVWRKFAFTFLTMWIFAIQSVHFAAYVVPWGQMTFFFAQFLPTTISAFMNAEGLGFIATMIGFCLLVIDLLLVLRRSDFWARLVGVFAVLLGVFLWMSPLAFLGQARSEFIATPPILSFYTMMVAMPSKASGVIVLFAALLTPATIPWANAEIHRESRLWPYWLTNVFAIAASLLLLGRLTEMGGEFPIVLARTLTAVFFFCIIVVPILLRWKK